MKLQNKYSLVENLAGRGRLLLEHTEGHKFEKTVIAFMTKQGYRATPESSYVYDMNLNNAKCEIKLYPVALLGDISVNNWDTIAFDMKANKFIIRGTPDQAFAAEFISEQMNLDTTSVTNMRKLCEYARFGKNDVVFLRKDGRAQYKEWQKATYSKDIKGYMKRGRKKPFEYEKKGSPLNWHAGYIGDLLGTEVEGPRGKMKRTKGNKQLAAFDIPGSVLTKYMAAKGVHYLISGDYGQDSGVVDEHVMIGHLGPKGDILGLGTPQVQIERSGRVTIGLRAKGGGKEHGSPENRPFGSFASVRVNTQAPGGFVEGSMASLHDILGI